MKKLFYLLFALITLNACRANFDWESVKKDPLKEEFKDCFAEAFGVYGVLNIDSTHVWGFTNFPYKEQPVETRAVRTNANEWGDYADVPDPLTQNQIDFVTNWFTVTNNPKGIAVSWTDYFAQQVSSTEYGSHMDYLLDAGTKGNDHVNNFNSGDCSINYNVWGGELTNPDDHNSKVFHADKIQYMIGQSTKDFAYHESVSHNTWYDHYVIIPGEMIDPANTLGENGESIWGMYFVGFDYEAFKYVGSSDNVSRDYYFNDWIIKISPGIPQPSKMQRIMAEDLGSMDATDFDFNDVVFDVWINYNPYWHGNDYGVLVLRAAGGTMPLYVDGHEVHEEFDVDVTTMVNTGGNQTTAPTVSRPIVMWNFVPTSANAIDIPIYVENTKNGKSYYIDSEKGVAPGKFAVPATVQWSQERINIKQTYPLFTAWCENQSIHFWE